MSTPVRRSAVAAAALVALALPGIVLPGGSARAGAATAGADPAVHDAAVAELAARRLVVRWADTTGARDRTASLASVGARVVHDLGSITVVELGAARAAVRAAARLADDPRVVEVETDRVVHTATADPGYEQQWGIDNRGQRVQGSTGRTGIDTSALAAWTHTSGEPEVLVAIVDSGMDVEHPDLAANIWRSPYDEPNDVDDDGNGLVDDVTGWDFKNDDDSVYDDAEGDSHGTELAGVIAAVADNELGIAGIAPAVRILPVKFLESGSGAMSDGLAGLRYAAAQGADVIVASWVGERDHPFLRDVLEGTRTLVVAPAGNDGKDLTVGATSYPASYTLPNLVSVAAIDNRGYLARFSNRGRRQVDLAAPGQEILTTDPSTHPGTGESLPGYAYVSGTSMAAAFTAGAAALALSVHPGLLAADLADLVRLSTRPYWSADGATVSGGLLDARRLVLLAEEAAKPGACHDPPVSDFEDVSRRSIHVLSIDCLVYRGTTAGRDEDHYDPHGPVTRAAMATFLLRVVEAAGMTVEDPPDAFTDDDGSIHEPSIDAVAELGIVEGREEGIYAPWELVTRAQMATMVRETYARLVGGTTDPSRTWFDDLAPPHADSVNAIRDLGIASGTVPREFEPAEVVRRDQMASFLAALLDVLARHGVLKPG